VIKIAQVNSSNLGSKPQIYVLRRQIWLRLIRKIFTLYYTYVVDARRKQTHRKWVCACLGTWQRR